MRSLSLAVALAALIPLASTFKDTVPIVAWSSQPSRKLDSLASRPEERGKFFDALVDKGDLCQFDAIIIVEQPGLHASDFRTLSHISANIKGAPSSLQLPYVAYPEGSITEHFKRSIEKQCGARRVELRLGQKGVTFQNGVRHLVSLRVPQVDGDGQDRKATMRTYETLLSGDIARVASALSSHLVIYYGSKPITKRQAKTSGDSADENKHPVDQKKASQQNSGPFAPINTTIPDGGLFQRYQFLTPGLITGFLISFGLLVPIIMIGVYALSSIRSPLRVDGPKAPSVDKKTQ